MGKKNQTRKTAAEPTTMFHFTADLMECSIHLFNRAEEFQNSDSNYLGSMAGSSILGTFPIEISLKYLESFEDSTNQFHEGHDLEQQFSKLSKGLQVEIQKEFESSTEMRLDHYLSKHKKVFEEWRYGFEKGKNLPTAVDAEETRLLIRILRNHVRNSVPIT